MNKKDEKRFWILKYISIIENTYKKRSDLRIILDDFYEGVKEIESKQDYSYELQFWKKCLHMTNHYKKSMKQKKVYTSEEVRKAMDIVLKEQARQIFKEILKFFELEDSCPEYNCGHFKELKSKWLKKKLVGL